MLHKPNVANTISPMSKLTNKQRRFVEEYLVDLNATEAARRAGYKGNEATLASVGSENLGKPYISSFIQEEMARRSERTQITQDRVLQEIARIAFLDPRKLFDKEGKPIPISDLDDDTAAAIAGLDVLEQYEGSGQDRQFVGYVKKIKLCDKNSALEKLCRHLGMFNDKLKLQGDKDNPVKVVHESVETYLQELATESEPTEEDGPVDD